MKDIDEIIKSIKESIKIFNKIFKFYADFKGNSKEDRYLLMPRKSYILAYLGSIFKKMIQEKDSFDNDLFIKKYSDRFKQYYIYDLLTNPFKTASSKNAYIAMLKGTYYNELNFKSFKDQIEIYYDDKNHIFDKEEFNHTSAVLMSMIYGHNISVSEHSENNFQNDHLIPKKKLKDLDIKNKSNFANFSLKKDSDNNGKGDKLNKVFIEEEPLTC
jgi:hypothetical protein